MIALTATASPAGARQAPFRTPKTLSGASRPLKHTRRGLLRPVRAEVDQQAAVQQSAAGDEIPPGCSRYTVTLNKPLGLVLEESKELGTIVVGEVLEGGNAAASGEISAGDILIATSGYCRTTEQVYNDIVVRGGEQIVRLTVRGESFDTVMAAITSHPASIPVRLEFQRC